MAGRSICGSRSQATPDTAAGPKATPKDVWPTSANRALALLAIRTPASMIDMVDLVAEDHAERHDSGNMNNGLPSASQMSSGERVSVAEAHA